MRCVVQRSGPAKVTIAGQVSGEIDSGLVVLIAFAPEDTDQEMSWMVRKLLGLRIFPDSEGRMNLSLQDVGGGILLVSQFTLYGNCSRGNRPGFSDSAAPDIALELYKKFGTMLRQQWPETAEGVFGASMEVNLTNQGPVTLILDRDASKEGSQKNGDHK